jgi:hypothetical protein
MALWLQALKLLQLSKNERKGQALWPQPLGEFWRWADRSRLQVQCSMAAKPEPLNFEH